MKIKRIITNGLEENCYIASDGTNGVIVDPGGCADFVLSAAQGICVQHILLTHGHFDHVLAANELREKLSAKVYISEKDASLLKDANSSLASDFGFTHDEIFYDEVLRDGDTLDIGTMPFEVIATPGHTEGSVCYLCKNVLFSGDTLFKMSVGVHDTKDGETMVSSIKKLMRLPADVRVFPGHNDDTTIGFERLNNPYAAIN